MHMLPLSRYINKLLNLSYLNCGLQFCQIWIQLLQCVETCKRNVTKHASLIWTNWNGDWQRSGPSWIMSSLRQSFVRGIVDSSRSVMSVLYNFSYNISHIRLSTGFKSGEFGGHSRGGINSGVSFLSNSMVAHARWAFRVLQGSVETLFTWGEIRLHHIDRVRSEICRCSAVSELRGSMAVSTVQGGLSCPGSRVTLQLRPVVVQIVIKQ